MKHDSHIMCERKVMKPAEVKRNMKNAFLINFQFDVIKCNRTERGGSLIKLIR